MIVDGYAHCGVRKYQPVEVVLDTMAQAGVDRAVLCQHLGEYDNSYLAQVVGSRPQQFAAVLLVNPSEPGASEKLRQWSAAGRFRGVRLLAEWLEPYFPLWQEAVRQGLHLILYAPDGIAEAVPSVRRLLRECPRARAVVSHLGNPKLIDGRLAHGPELFQLEQEAGALVLISGLSMFCVYPYTELREFVSDVIRRFGPQRLMWGSNFPVCGDAAAYQRDVIHFRTGDWGVSSDVIDAIIGGTARNLWFGDGCA